MDMRARTALSLLCLLVGSGIAQAAETTSAASPRGGANPQECFDAVHQARASGDYRRLVDHLTEATACSMAGQVAIELDQLVFLRMAQADQAREVLKQYGLAGCDIRGAHLSGGRQEDSARAMLRVGAWVEDPAGFLKAGNALLDTVRQEAPLALERELKRARGVLADQLAAAKTESERKQLVQEQQGIIAALEQASAEASLQCRAAEEYRQSLAKAELQNIKITGEFAQGLVLMGKNVSVANFRRVDRRWLLATGSDEPAIKRPSKGERQLARLISLGRHDFEPAHPEQIVCFRYEADDSHDDLSDRDLQLLADMSSVREVELTGAARITPAGIESLSRLPGLERLKLCSLPVTAVSLENLVGAKKLKHLELVNLDLSDAAVSSLRDKLPDCTLEEKYCLTPASWKGGFQKQRDRSRFAIFMAAPGLDRLTASDTAVKISSSANLDKPLTPAEHPQLKPLARAVARLNVQVFSESPLDRLGDAWWKENPWFQRGRLPQYAIFAPNSDEPIVLAGEVSAEQLTAALIELVRKTRRESKGK